MKSMIYIAYVDKAKDIGVYKKVLSQCIEFNKYYETVLIYINNNDICIENITLNKIELIEKALLPIDKINNISIKINKYNNYKIFNSFTAKFIEQYKPEIIYIRRYNLLFNGISILKHAKRIFRCYIICEIPTFPYKVEFLKNNKYLMYWYYRYLDKMIENIVDKITIVLGSNVNLDEKKYLAFMNGIDISSLVCKKKTKSDIDTCLNLLGAAQLAFWHGYDRVIEGLNNYYKDNKFKIIDVNFHIVGNGNELVKLREMVDEYDLNKHVTFHGQKSGQELDELMNITDIGIGSLAMHRSGLTCGCTLKAREYCARGIPFIIGYVDNGFKNDFKYTLKVKADESPVDINKVIEFYDFIKENNYIEDMRMYAEQNLTWEVVMKPIINAINEGV